jgi:hypothetical protein
MKDQGKPVMRSFGAMSGTFQKSYCYLREGNVSLAYENSEAVLQKGCLINPRTPCFVTHKKMEELDP